MAIGGIGSIKAITLDLDDTLWPIAPVMTRAEERLDAWLQEHCPRAAEKFPIQAMRELRDRIAEENPHVSHDFTAQRKLSLQAALLPHGYEDSHVENAFTEFYSARNEIDCYPDSWAAMERLAARYPLVSITNGNADLERIGMAHFFRHTITARGCGVAKPDAQIFALACEKLGLGAAEILHVGDDPQLDVIGAHRAGLRTVWINRVGATWTHDIQPDIVVHDLTQLADLLDRDGGTGDVRLSA
jgi:FMN hydrolase / 5-amino-6-(5-phospho-D-ribitylamino)uracil phosphatase